MTVGREQYWPNLDLVLAIFWDPPVEGFIRRLTGGVLDIRNAPYLFTCYASPPLTSPRGTISDYCRGGGGTMYHTMSPRRSSKSFLLKAVRDTVA